MLVSTVSCITSQPCLPTWHCHRHHLSLSQVAKPFPKLPRLSQVATFIFVAISIIASPLALSRHHLDVIVVVAAATLADLPLFLSPSSSSFSFPSCQALSHVATPFPSGHFHFRRHRHRRVVISMSWLLSPPPSLPTCLCSCRHGEGSDERGVYYRYE